MPKPRLRRTGGEGVSADRSEGLDSTVPLAAVFIDDVVSDGSGVGRQPEAAAPVESGLHGETLIPRILDEGVLQAIERFGQGSLAARGRAQFVSHR